MSEFQFAEFEPVQDKPASNTTDYVGGAKQLYFDLAEAKCMGGGPGAKCGGLPSVEIGEGEGEQGDKPSKEDWEDIFRHLKPGKDVFKEVDREDVDYITDLLTEHGDFRNDFKRGRVQEILGKYAEAGNVKSLVANINKELGRRGSELHIEYDSRKDDGDHGFHRSLPSTTHTLSVIKPGEEEPEDVVTYVESEYKIRGL